MSTAAEVALAPQFAEFAAVLPFGLGDAITATAPGLLTLAHAFAPFAAVIGIALTLLYLKLNWFEPTWRREVLDATNAKGIAFTEISLTAHCPALPIAVLDVLGEAKAHAESLRARSSFLILITKLEPTTAVKSRAVVCRVRK